MSASKPEVHDVFATLMELLEIDLRDFTGSVTFNCCEGRFEKFHADRYGRVPRDTRPCRKPGLDRED